MKKTQGDVKHKVSSGETMYALAKKYKCEFKKKLWNGMASRIYNLKDGEIILIKQK